MRFSLIILTTSILFSCTTKKKIEYGTVSGNIFYKDYNFINRPDAGSRIRLINYEDSNHIYFTKADIRGDFNIDKVAEGSYLQVVQSDNARSSYFSLATSINEYRSLIQRIYNEKLDTLFFINLKKAEYYDNLEKKESTNTTNDGELKNYKYAASLQDTCEYYSEKAMTFVPRGIKYDLGMTLLYMVDLKAVHVNPGRPVNSTINFGVGNVRLNLNY